MPLLHFPISFSEMEPCIFLFLTHLSDAAVCLFPALHQFLCVRRAVWIVIASLASIVFCI